MIDLSLRVLLCAGLSAALGGAVLAFGHHERDVGRAEVRRESARDQQQRQTVVIKRQADVLATEHVQADKAQEVDTHVQTQLAAAAADRDRARSALAGLRDELARVRADALSGAATGASLAAQAAAAADSLSECSSRYTAVAGERDELSIQVAGLLALAPPE